MSPFIFKIPPFLGYIEVDKITASDIVAGNTFGKALAIDGTVAVIGIDSAAYIFEYNGTAWLEVQKIKASSGTPSTFGFSVAVSGTTVVVGAYNADPDGITDAGAVYVYEKSGGTWPATETAMLKASDKVTIDRLGYSVAIDGTTVIAGATFSDPGGFTDAGAAYVFEKGGTWPATETAKLSASDKLNSDNFGYSVAISGTTIVVGVRYSDPGGVSNAGSAYVFEKSGTWPATETAKLLASDQDANNNFGARASVSGTTIVITAPGNNGATGAAYVFENTGTWNETQKLIASDAAGVDRFGESVSYNGNTIVVGAYDEDPNGLTGAGSAYVFDYNGTWNETQKLIASDGVAGDNFGISVSVSGNTIFVGARYSDVGALNQAGNAYIFEK